MSEQISQILATSSQKVQDALSAFGISLHVLELASSTRTAEEAASTIGCSVDQIAKSLIFEGAKTQLPILVIASGKNRVDEKKLELLVAEKIKRASPEFVREVTGFAIGGIPPVGHSQKIITFIDEDLAAYPELWAAAGTPFSVFKLTFEELVAITSGTVCGIK